MQTIDIYPSDGELHTEQFIPTDQMVDCNFFTRLGTDWEQASKYFPYRKVSIRTGVYCTNVIVIWCGVIIEVLYYIIQCKMLRIIVDNIYYLVLVSC